MNTESRNSADGAWTDLRAKMPVCQKWAYFDHAAVAPLPAPSVMTMQNWAQEAAAEGDAVWARWKRRVEAIRGHVAQLIHAGTEEVAFLPNTSTGISWVAEGYPWQAGDNVVTLANEFPSNLFPWLHLADRGVEMRKVEVEDGRVELNRILAACDDRTRLVSVSWVGYASGWRLDVADLADLLHQRDIHLFVDAIQGMGVFPMDVAASGIDYLAADGHKWMLGPEGAGIFFCAKRHLSRIRPIVVGWNSVENAAQFSSNFELRRDAGRFEAGTYNMAGILTLGTSLELLAAAGLSARESRVADRVVNLADEIAERVVAHGADLLFDRDPNHRSGILVFRLPGWTPDEVRSACRSAGVIVSCRGGGVRVSPHAYNNREDIDRLLDALPRPKLSGS